MSAPTPPKKERIHHHLISHAKTPRGIVILVGMLFFLSWIIWTFLLSPAAAIY